MINACVQGRGQVMQLAGHMRRWRFAEVFDTGEVLVYKSP